jgi:peroxisomal membrane protein 4
VLVGLGKHLQERAFPKRLQFHTSYPLFAAAVWGLVMMLFEERPDVLHPSLKKSMDEIYRYKIQQSRIAS